VDPEKWVPSGYVVMRVDSRGAGRSPGYLDPFSPRETADLYACIEWAASQPWSSGKVGLNGISYYAINQWLVASQRPPGLAAICVWEGAADWYRDMTHHGGILSTFFANWYDMQVKTVQYGLGSRGARSPVTGVNACGDEDLSPGELESNRTDLGRAILAHPLDDDYHRRRSADFEAIEVPLLSAANWGGLGLHSRGNFEGFYRAGSDQKWLEVHGLEHWTHFYTDYGRTLQLRFFDHFLKGVENGWEKTPPVLLQVRHLDHFEERTEAAWPIPRTRFTPLHLHPDLTLQAQPPRAPSRVELETTGPGVTFFTSPLPADTEYTGPGAVKLWISSSTADADLFLVLRLFDPEGEEVAFQGALDPHTPLSQGWLRASHRRLDPALSQPWRPVHLHAARQPLEPGEVYELDIEMWPTSIVVPAGYRLGLTVRGGDYEFPGAGEDEGLSTFKNRFRGCGPFLHDDPRDRPPGLFSGTTTIHLGPDHPGYWLAPLVPAPE
jgi:predicted acyl esterase